MALITAKKKKMKKNIFPFKKISSQSFLKKTNSYCTNIKPTQVKKSEEEWKEILTTHQYKIMRQKMREIPFKNEYWNKSGRGTYCCAGCKIPLFDSYHKFDALNGWASFSASIEENISLVKDNSFQMERTEIKCKW